MSGDGAAVTGPSAPADLAGVANAASRIFLISPASCTGLRARQLMSERASFELARRVRTPDGAPLGAVFSLLSGLYFRGKLAYANAFASPPTGAPSVLIITPGEGLLPPETPVTLRRLQAFARIPIDVTSRRYRTPLTRDVERLVDVTGPGCELVLLGSIATGKYLDVLLPLVGDRLRYPSDFVGRGDMSRGGLLLRCVASGQPLSYVRVADGPRHGPRPDRLPKLAR